MPWPFAQKAEGEGKGKGKGGGNSNIFDKLADYEKRVTELEATLTKREDEIRVRDRAQREAAMTTELDTLQREADREYDQMRRALESSS